MDDDSREEQIIKLEELRIEIEPWPPCIMCGNLLAVRDAPSWEAKTHSGQDHKFVRRDDGGIVKVVRRWMIATTEEALTQADVDELSNRGELSAPDIDPKQVVLESGEVGIRIQPLREQSNRNA